MLYRSTLLFLCLASRLLLAQATVVGYPVSGSKPAGEQYTFQFAYSDTNGISSMAHMEVYISASLWLSGPTCDIGLEYGAFWLVLDNARWAVR